MSLNIENFKKVREAIAKAKPEECYMDNWSREEACGCFIGFCYRVGADGVGTTPFLGLDRYEDYKALTREFPTFHDVPAEGWQQWMLRRLDRIIEDGVIKPWQEQL